MDKVHKINTVNITRHFMSNKTNNSKINIIHQNLKNTISETDEKLISTSNYGKTKNDSDISSLSNSKPNNNDILYNNLQSSISYSTGKTILKNKYGMTSTINLEKKANSHKKNIFGTILSRNVKNIKNIKQNSIEISDYSYSDLLKKDNEFQGIKTPLNKKITKCKNVSFFKISEEAKSNLNKQKFNKKRKSLLKNYKQKFFSDFKDESKTSSDILSKIKNNRIKKNNNQKSKFNRTKLFYFFE